MHSQLSQCHIGKVESFEWICPLENVLDGSWVKQEDFKQPSLFEEDNA